MIVPCRADNDRDAPSAIYVSHSNAIGLDSGVLLQNPLERLIDSGNAFAGPKQWFMASPELARRTNRMNSVSGVQAWIDSYKDKPIDLLDDESPIRDSDSGPDDGDDDSNSMVPDYLEARLWYLKVRAYPNDSIDTIAYKAALAHRDAMPAAILPVAAAAHTGGLGSHAIGGFGNWKFVGPTNLAVPYVTYYGTQALTGRVNALAFDPTTTGTYYLGGASGGVWKTIDSGVTWTPLTDSAWPDLQVSSLAIDPKNHLTVYAGTGDFDGDNQFGIGIMKSTDGGKTWTQLGNAEFGNNAVSSIVVDPDNDSIVTASTGRGSNFWGDVWRSTDGGQTWSEVISQANSVWSDLEVGLKSASGVRTYYAAGVSYDSTSPSGYDGEIWTSADSGASWTQQAYPQPALVDWDSIIRVAPSKTNSQTVYLMSTAPESSSGVFSTDYNSIWESTSAGAGWSNISGPLADDSTQLGGYNFSQFWYDANLSCSTITDTSTHDALYLQMIDVDQSPDASTDWASIGGPCYTGNSLVHNDEHSVAWNPANPLEALFGNDGGVFDEVYDPSSQPPAPTWKSLNQNLGLTQFYHGSWDPTNPDIMIGGCQDNATPYSGGDIGNWLNVGGGDGGGCAINQQNDQEQYDCSQYLNISYTTNGWGSSMGITPTNSSNQQWNGESVPFIGTMVIDPSDPNLLYAGTDHVWQFNATSQSWSPDLGGIPLAGGNSSGATILSIAVAPTDSNRIYTGSTDGELFMSTNQGASWNEINTAPLPNRAISAISVNPKNENDILVGVSGTGTDHMWECANTTATAPVTFTDINGSGSTGLPDISLNTIARDLTNPTSSYYVGTDVGVFYTSNGGATWSNGTVPLGLPNVQVNELGAVPGTGYLNAATFGRGMWRIAIKAPPPPAAPSALSASAGTDQVDLSWQGSTGATTYDVYRGPASGAEGSSPYKSGLTTVTFTDSGLGAADYFYKVAAVNAGGTSALSNEASASPTDAPPLAPTALTAVGGESQIALSWHSSTAATAYSVYRGTSSRGESGDPIAVVSGTTYTNTGVAPGTVFYYVVKAVNAYGSSGNSPEASATPIGTFAQFVKNDATTSGNWKGVYGGDGFNVIADTSADNPSMPAYASITPTGNATAAWATTSTAKYCLEAAAPGSTNRVAGAWWSTGSFTVNVDVTGGLVRQVALYLLDWKDAGRSEIITVTNAVTHAVLASEKASSFDNGLYQVWKVYGNVDITVTRDGGSNAVLSGIFFGAGTPTVVPDAPHNLTAAPGRDEIALTWSASGIATSYTVYRGTASGKETTLAAGVDTTTFTDAEAIPGTKYYYSVAGVNGSGTGARSNEAFATATPSTATFVKNDTTTAGSWKGVYGGDGCDIVADPSTNNPTIPSYATLSESGDSLATWTTSSTEPYAVHVAEPGSTNRVLGAWYAAKSFSFDLSVTGTTPREVDFYMADWQDRGRAETITISDTKSHVTIASAPASSFAKGLYQVWDILGSVTITVKSANAQSAVVSAVFFGAGKPTVAPAAPTGLAAASIPGAIDLTWPADGTATSYNIYRGPTSGSEAAAPIASGVSALSFTNTGLSASSKYYYEIAAVNAAGSSSKSNEVSAKPGTAEVTFVTSDFMGGSWKGVYGTDGYDVIGDPSSDNPKIPSYVTMSETGSKSTVWTASDSSDPTALQEAAAGSTNRLLGAWYAPNTFTINLTVNGMHEVALYMVDWGNWGREQTITVTDATSGVVLSSQAAAGFSTGLWEVWNINGAVKINVTQLDGNDAVLSGIFFGK